MPSAVVSAGAGHTACFLSDTGSETPDEKRVSLYCWGQGEDGQLGVGDSEDTHRPKEVTDLSDMKVEGICCGAHHTIAVTVEPTREVYAWGWGDFGRLGTGDPGDRLSPAKLPCFMGARIEHMACGDSHCLVITQIGWLWTFGRNQNGQLGLGDTTDRLEPCRVESLSKKTIKVRRAAGGAEHSAITTEDGAMYTFGWGRYGNLGHGNCEDLHVPTLVESLVGIKVTDPVCGWRHSAALTDAGRLWTFGWSKYGQLGHGDNKDHWVPKLLPEFEGGAITSASGGWRHMCALAKDGTLYAWGWNQFGQLGVGSLEDANAPQKVVLGNVRSVSCGWRHTVAVAGDGNEIYTWGRCVHGQLGHGDTTQRNIPTQVISLELLRQGIAPIAKRQRENLDDMQVPSQSKKPHNETVETDAAAVPDEAN